MAVTAEIYAPISGTVFPLTILRPATTVDVSGGVGNYDIDFQWDTVTSFDSGNLITVSQNNVVAGEYTSVPTADLDGGSTWFIRVVVDDLGDGSDTTATNTLTWFDPVDSDRFLYVATMVQVGFEGDPPTEGWRQITGSDPGDGDELDFDRFLYTGANVQIGFEGDPPSEGWRQITGSDPGDGDELDFDRFLYVAANVEIGFEGDPPPEGWRQITGSDPGDGDEIDFDRFLYAAVNVTADKFLSGSGNASSDGSGDMAVEAAPDVDLAGSGHAAADGAGPLNLDPAALAGGGDAAVDASAAFTVQVLISGGGDAASDGVATLSVSGPADLDGSGHASSEGTGDLVLDPVAVAGSGNASADASAAFTVRVFLSGSGNASSEGSGVLGTSLELSGSGHAASDGTGDMGDFSFMSGAGLAASEGSAELSVTINITLSVTLPVLSFVALLEHIENPGLVGGVIRPSSAAYAPFSAVGGTATGSPGGQQGDYFPNIADPSLYQPLIMWRERHVVAGDEQLPAVFTPVEEILENQ